jgi:anthranilate phosphoribosyltransferase
LLTEAASGEANQVKSLINQLKQGKDLSAAEVQRAVSGLVSRETADADKAEFLKALRAKGETAAEIAAFAQAMLSLAVDPKIDASELSGPVIDVCGTGGDKLDLFNVSTAAMFVLAAGGAVVIKHGNRAITSKCGGADVLEELGVKIDLPPDGLRDVARRHGAAFIFAPAYHPAFKAIVPVRRALAEEGISTVFNLLGPLLNPVRPVHQLVGIFSPTLLPTYAEVLNLLGRSKAWVVHGSGMDELSLCGPTEVREIRGGVIRELTIVAEALGLPRCAVEELRGGDRVENARILVSILDGSERGPKRDLVLLNAAAGFVACNLAPDLGTGLERARAQIANGAALAKLNALRSN